MKKLIILSLLILSYSSQALTSEDYFQENAYRNAVIAYEEGNYQKAFNIWSKRATPGILDWFDADHAAQYQLGLMYKDGVGVEKDYKEALKWFKKSAKSGYAKAQYMYGYMNYKGFGSDHIHTDLAFRWIMKSAKQGYDQAEFMIGWMYDNSIGVEEDKQLAYKWINLAASQGNKDAIRWLSPGEISKAQPIPKLNYGKYLALIIGNDNYTELKPLKNAGNDADALASLLKSKYGFEVEILKDANREDTLKAMAQIRKKATKNDNVLIYYAGHGWLEESTDDGFWLPINSSMDEETNWIPNTDIIRSINRMEAKHVLVVADSCFSGTLTRGVSISERNSNFIEKIVNKKSRTVLTSGGLEPVSDVGAYGNSIFASVLLSILRENQGVIDGSTLFNMLREKVVINSDQTPEYGNIRKAGHDGGDFLFVKKQN